jgi:hypothetical protein
MWLSSVNGTVYRRLHTLPMVTVWLGCPRFGGLAWDFRVCTLTHSATRNYHMHDGLATQVHIQFNHINLIYSLGSDGLFVLNPSVWNIYIYFYFTNALRNITNSIILSLGQMSFC